MTIDRISFSETVEFMDEYGKKHWVKTSAEGSLLPIDDIQQSYNELKSHAINALYAKNNPHLYQEQTPIAEEPVVLWGEPLRKTSQPIEKQSEEKITPEETRRYIIEQIHNSTTLSELKQWDLLSRKYDDASVEYTQKEKELS